MADANDEEIQIETPPTIGERLRRAREAKQLSIPEVSSQIRLVRDNIESIEAGQWGDLHGRAYARGYLISYVKFLGLPEEEFIAGFNREYETSAPEAPLSTNVAGLMESKGFPWFKILLIGLLAVMAWFAYQQWLQYEADLAAEVTPSVEGAEPLPETNSFSSSVVEPILESEESSHNSDLTLVEQEVDVIAEVSEMIIENSVDEQVVESVETEELTAITPIEQPASDTHIALSFTEDCWVNVTDAKGESLLDKVMKANTNIELNGQAPFNFSLGRASAVTMKVNNAVFDLAPHTRNDVAKFTLGAES